MIALIAGMQGSDSTFSFNAARELLQARCGVAIVTTNRFEEAVSSARDGSANLIIKSHAPDEAMNSMVAKGAITCICTVRKPEDAVASLTKVFSFGIQESAATIAAWLDWHRKMCCHSLIGVGTSDSTIDSVTRSFSFTNAFGADK